MKKKKTNIILIVGVLALWVVIGMRFMEGFGGDEEFVANQQASSIDMRFVKLKRDSFKLSLDYKDPFMGINWKDDYSMQAGNLEEPTAPVQMPAMVMHVPPPDYHQQWVRIKYKGRIKNRTNKRTKLILQIDEQEYLVNSGDEVMGFKIEKASFDSVWLTIGETTKSFSVVK